MSGYISDIRSVSPLVVNIVAALISKFGDDQSSVLTRVKPASYFRWDFPNSLNKRIHLPGPSSSDCFTRYTRIFGIIIVIMVGKFGPKKI